MEAIETTEEILIFFAKIIFRGRENESQRPTQALADSDEHIASDHKLINLFLDALTQFRGAIV